MLRRPTFKCKHRVTVLACEIRDSGAMSPAVVFQDNRKYLLTTEKSSESVRETVLGQYVLFWQRKSHP